MGQDARHYVSDCLQAIVTDFSTESLAAQVSARLHQAAAHDELQHVPTPGQNLQILHRFQRGAGGVGGAGAGAGGDDGGDGDGGGDVDRDGYGGCNFHARVMRMDVA